MCREQLYWKCRVQTIFILWMSSYWPLRIRIGWFVSLASHSNSWTIYFFQSSLHRSWDGKVTIRNGPLRKPCKKQGFRNKVKCIIHKKQGFRIDFDRTFVSIFTGPSYRSYRAIVTLKHLVWSLVRYCWHGFILRLVFYQNYNEKSSRAEKENRKIDTDKF